MFRKIFETDISEHNFEVQIIAGYRMFNLLEEQNLVQNLICELKCEGYQDSTLSLKYSSSLDNSDVSLAMRIKNDVFIPFSQEEIDSLLNVEEETVSVNNEKEKCFMEFPEDDIDIDSHFINLNETLYQLLIGEGYEFLSYKDLIWKTCQL
ncbi:hypothetical protein [Piscibacillus salipiscarius]|nr:hypothetical protein [Piscibacillus salipiscarius]